MGKLLLIAAALAGLTLFSRRKDAPPAPDILPPQGAGAPGRPVIAPFLTLQAGTTSLAAFAEPTAVRVVTSKGSTSNAKTYPNVIAATADGLKNFDAEAPPAIAVQGTYVRADGSTTTLIVSKAKDGWVYTTGDGWIGEGTTRLRALRAAVTDAKKVPQTAGVNVA
jgi:hypothetical protein